MWVVSSPGFIVSSSFSSASLIGGIGRFGIRSSCRGLKSYILAARGSLSVTCREGVYFQKGAPQGSSLVISSRWSLEMCLLRLVKVLGFNVPGSTSGYRRCFRLSILPFFAHSAISCSNLTICEGFLALSLSLLVSP